MIDRPARHPEVPADARVCKRAFVKVPPHWNEMTQAEKRASAGAIARELARQLTPERDDRRESR